MVEGWLAPAATEAQADLYSFTVPHIASPDRSRRSGEEKDLARTATTDSCEISHAAELRQVRRDFRKKEVWHGKVLERTQGRSPISSAGKVGLGSYRLSSHPASVQRSSRRADCGSPVSPRPE